MKIFLISIILLFLIPVPDTDTFSLNDVADEIENNGRGIVLSLQDAFDQAEASGFADDPHDPGATYYDTYGNSLLAFRNYSHEQQTSTITVSPTTANYLDFGGGKNFTITTATNDTWSISRPKFDMWLTLDKIHGTGSTTFRATCALNFGEPRETILTITSSLGTVHVYIFQGGGGMI